MMNTMHELYVTMAAGTGAKEGEVCKLTDDCKVGACAEGDILCGVCGPVRNGNAGVLLHGLAVVKYSGSTAPSVGFSTLSADGAGGVAVDEDGKDYLVVSVDTTAKTVSLVL